MSVEIREIKSHWDLRKFIQFPNELYQDNQYYVPSLFIDDLNTLDPNKNPAFQDCQARYWLAYKDGKIAGRVCAILNNLHIEKWGQKYLRFSWLDFIDDHEVSAALISVVEGWAKELGMEAVHGPLGFTDLDREGMLVEGFAELSTMATFYNFPYYLNHMESLGYEKDIDWIEFELTVPEKQNEKISRAAEIVAKRNDLKLLVLDHKKELLPYAKELFNLLVDEYSHLYGTNPLNEQQIDAYIKQYFGFVHQDFIPLIVDTQGKLVAFGIAIPFLSKALQRSKGRLFPFGWWFLLQALRKNDRADLMLVAVKKEYQGSGVNAILMDKLTKVFLDRGIKKVESNPELETNANVQSLWKLYEKRQHKRRRIFIKKLTLD
jgi:GNAT superfamily N-acetyltransferase